MAQRKSGLRKDYKIKVDVSGLASKPMVPPSYFDSIDETKDATQTNQDQPSTPENIANPSNAENNENSNVVDKKAVEQTVQDQSQTADVSAPITKPQQSRRNFGVNTDTDDQIEWVLAHFSETQSGKIKM